MANGFLFTSESVSEGHPDKMADQISDAVLDAMLAQDPRSRVACETLGNTGLAVIAGEVTSSAQVDLAQTVRDTIADIGYTSSEMGFDAASCAVMVTLDKQSPDIAQGVNEGEGLDRDQGAGDQGLMFGFACNETDVLMPFPITYSHRLVKRQADVRKSGKLSWLRPDAKSQVSVRYEDGKPVSIDTVVLSTQHSEDVDHATLSEAVIEEIIRPVLPADMITARHPVSGEPHGPIRHRRPARRLWSHRPQNHCRHLRGLRPPRRRARSPARIPAKSIARPPTPCAMWPRTSWPLA